MIQTKLYIPIENLNVESKIKIGKATIYPTDQVQSLIKRLKVITDKAKNTKKQKRKLIDWQEKDLNLHFGKYAFIEIQRQINKQDDLIPKDLTLIYEQIKEVLAVLYLLQKQIAGVCSIETQKFGLSKELNRSLNFLISIQGNKKSSYSFHREGVLADWTFVNREINKFSTNAVYCYFSKVLKKDVKSEIENRLISSVVWLYDAIMDFNPSNRFVKLAISLEVLFASGKDKKSFRLSRFSTLLSHLYMFKNWKCLCPILESHSTKEYIVNIKKLKHPGICSAYWDLRKWYKIRSNIVHDAVRVIDKKELTSFEWWTHKLIIATIEVISKEKVSTLDELEFFLENKYRAYKATW